MRFTIDSTGLADMSTFETLWASHEAFVPAVRDAYLSRPVPPG